MSESGNVSWKNCNLFVRRYESLGLDLVFTVQVFSWSAAPIPFYPARGMGHFRTSSSSSERNTLYIFGPFGPSITANRLSKYRP